METYQVISLVLGYFTVGAISALIDVTLSISDQEEGAPTLMFFFWPVMWLYFAFLTVLAFLGPED